MAIQAPIARMTEEEYRAFALGDGNGHCELVRGALREKPGMSVEHGDWMIVLAAELHRQLDRSQFRVRVNHAKLRRSASTYYAPDIAVVPTEFERALRPGSLDAYPKPLPLVIEIWSPSTGSYDIHEKLPDYQAGGDLETWYAHPYQRAVSVWRRQLDGSCVQSVHRGGELRPASLPGVVINLDVLVAE